MSIPVTETDEYKTLTKVLEVLEQQRESIVKDKDFLKNTYSSAINDPINFIENLINGKIKLPGKQVIEQVPNINVNFTRSTRSPLYPDFFKEKDRDKNNKKELWSESEQRKLEQLLIQYPPEEIASHRWSKIAKSLGNRTPKQVASRTQKYFIKLQKLGLPVPDGKAYTPINSQIKKRKKENDTPDKTDHKFTSNSNVNISFENPKNKLTTTTDSFGNSIIHEGFKCDGCDSEPIVGIRWRCEECMELDLCDDCKNNYEEIGSHKSNHYMIAHEKAEAPYYQDYDYKFSYPDRESNYLDPNY
eukprot:gene5414-6753_t